ncbi:MAG: arsenite efflux transporter metallochaperone ArsD [Desulfobulbaceae bacterium]
MKKIEVFDPALCCPTGVCGPSVDPRLVRFAADLEWLKSKGVQVERYNLAQQPDKFASCKSVTDAMMLAGELCLPLILADGEIVSRGGYPEREQLARLAGLGEEK